MKDTASCQQPAFVQAFATLRDEGGWLKFKVLGSGIGVLLRGSKLRNRVWNFPCADVCVGCRSNARVPTVSALTGVTPSKKASGSGVQAQVPILESPSWATS